ncbi:hypothetical protein QGN29_13405 [Temperatibacter marinus]|uniref:Uncharacterized protein n=1 Tax=Temperatibacter marinus TaxID=1456591 RepID=A0AA52H957_9PROT|nr:hypothetical protein [Temperatibacter marinus]WND02544.1 hypothetical protein QGN29_13405 [Temperatibacter marinus]
MDTQNFNVALNLDYPESDSRYINLGQVYRKQTMGENFWLDVLSGMAKQLMEITNEMPESLEADDVSKMLHNEYRFEPLLGLASILEKPHLVPFYGETVIINGVACAGISKLSEQLLDILRREKILDPVPYTKVPGNLSIDNMEFDLQEKEVHLIGRKRLRPIGDLKHDLARFSFSLEGGFQALRMKLDGTNGFSIKGYESNQKRMVKSMFKRWLQRLNPDLVRQIPLIIALDCFVAIRSGGFTPLEQQSILARAIYGMHEYTNDRLFK